MDKQIKELDDQYDELKKQIKESKLFKEHGFDLIEVMDQCFEYYRDIFENEKTYISEHESICIKLSDCFKYVPLFADRSEFVNIFKPYFNADYGAYFFPKTFDFVQKRMQVCNFIRNILKEMKEDAEN